MLHITNPSLEDKNHLQWDESILSRTYLYIIIRIKNAAGSESNVHVKSLSESEIPTKEHYSVLEQLGLKLDIYQRWSFVDSNYFTEIKYSQLYY